MDITTRLKRIKNGILNNIKNPYNTMVIIAVVILIMLVVAPLFEMVLTTFKLSPTDVRRVAGAEVDDYTLYYWDKLFRGVSSKNMLYKPLIHSLMIATIVSFSSIILGGAVAWLMIRSDIPYKKFFSLAMIIPYMIPSWCKSMAWIAVFKTSRIGGSQGFLSYIGIEPPDGLAYGPVAIICVLTIHYYAYAYLLISASLKTINSELEEMAQVLGANKFHMLKKITFPLVMPAMASSFILIFSKAMGTFGVPAFLGLKTGYYTISTMLYTSIKQRQTAIAYAISLMLIGIAAVIIFVNQQIIGRRKSYATISGKGNKSNVISLGKWKNPILLILMLFLFLCVFFPVIILVLQSLMLRLGDYSLSNFSLHYWIGKGIPDVFYGEPGVFKNPQFGKVLFNSLKLVVIASFVATIIGQIIGYIISRGRRLRSGRLVEQLVFIPYLIPSIAFGAMYLSMFSTEKSFIISGYKFTIFPVLYGTFLILILVTVVKNLPFSSRAGAANMMQINVELEEAAIVEKAGFLTVFKKIVLPLSKNGFISGFMLIFMAVMKELDLLVVLISPTTQTLPYMAYSYMSGGMEQFSNVVAIIMFMIVFVIYWIANRFFNADITQGF